MKVSNIQNFTNGWFIGDFEPSLLKTESFEVAHHLYPKGYTAPLHYHKIATEFNYIIKGKVKIKEITLEDGDIFIYDPYEVSEVEFLEDTSLMIIKTPSISIDKYLV
jgi:quercetin dioxygenase-like cupin family protein